MRKMILMFGVAVAFVSRSLEAATETVNGYTWTYSIQNNAAVIHKDSFGAISPNPNGAVTIPSTLGGYPVTSIGDYAFSYCSGLTSVTIPDGVTSIGEYAFYGCTNLTSVTIPDSVTNIGYCAFSGCNGLRDVKLPQYACGRQLSSIFPDSYQIITNVVISDSVTSIGEYAFYNCNGLTSVVFPNAVTNIAYSAFYGCYGLRSITIPQSLLPDDGTYPSRLSRTFRDWSQSLEIVVAEGVTNIPPLAFYDCWGIGSVTIPSSVKIIDAYAFYRCSYLTNVTIACGVTNIGDYAFSDCRYLFDITIPEGVVSIGERAFEDCTYLQSITIPSTVRNIGSGAFYGCYNLRRVNIFDLAAWCAISFGTSGTNSYYDQCSNPLYNAYYRYSNYNTSGGLYLNGEPLSGELAIPDNVTSICAYAFAGCTGITSVNIPDSVTSIGDGAFAGCTNLTSVAIPNTVTNITYGAFSGCSNLRSITVPQSLLSKGLSHDSRITDIVIADGVTNVSPRAFYYCSELKSVTIPDSVTSIGDYAFHGCSRLTSITIPSSVKSIGYNAFGPTTSPEIHAPSIADWCSISFGYYWHGYNYKATILFDDVSAQDSLEIPEGVERINAYAFYGFQNIKSVIIPRSLKSVGTDAFYPSSMTSVHIEDLSAWCRIAFANPSANPLYSKGTFYLNGEPLSGELVLPDGLTAIAPAAFCNCRNLTGVTIPNSVTNIGSYAFLGCSGLSGITIPDSVASIGSYAFSGCSGLASITVSDPDCAIGNGAFANCTGLADEDGFTVFRGILYDYSGNATDVVVPDNVFKVSSSAFSGCTNMQHVALHDGITAIGSSAFYNCSGLTSVAIGNGVTDIGSSAFDGCRSLADVVIPDSVTSIGSYAFYNCSNLTSAVIGNGVPNIGSSAFYNCDNLTSVVIGNGVTNIGYYAFENCSGLTSVTIPDSVTSIGSYAFYNCSNLTSAVIGNGVTNIGSSTFYNCSGLTSITIPDGVTTIEYSAFYNCSGLTSVTIPDSVTSIGSSAFYNCSGLTSVTIPDSVTSIGSSAFNYCDNIKHVTIPQCVCNSRLSSVFGYSGTVTTRYSDGTVVTNYHSGYRSIETVAISAGVTNIGSYAFSGCTNLASVIIPSSVTDIGSYAFSQCGNLSSLVFEGNAPTVSDWTFSNVGSNCTAYVNPGSTGWGVEIPGTWNGVRIEYRADGTPNGEFVNAGDMDFTTAGDAPWAGQTAVAHDGVAALRSGAISDGESSRLECAVSGAGELRFWWKVSSEEPFRGVPLDYVAFYVDGVRKEWIAGETDWTNVVVSVEGDGRHVLAWVYQKDDWEDTSAGEDCAWLDEVTWTPTGVPQTVFELPDGSDGSELYFFDETAVVYGVDNYIKVGLSSPADVPLVIRVTRTPRATSDPGILNFADAETEGAVYVTILAGTVGAYARVDFEQLDGTKGSASASGGFLLTATVTNTMQNADGTPYNEVYGVGGTSVRVFVGNVAPSVEVYPEPGAKSGTNDFYEASVSANEPLNIKWIITDVDADVNNNLKLRWTGLPSNATYTQGSATSAEGNIQFSFDSSGTHTVTLTVVDKDKGSSETFKFVYRIASSKNVYITPLGPSRNGQSQTSTDYLGAAGLGEGRVFIVGATNPDTEDYRQSWNYSPLDSSAMAWAVGYREGDVDDGNLPVYDRAIDKSGNNHNKPLANYYSYESSIDNFFYAWIHIETSDQGGGTTGTAYANPQLGSEDYKSRVFELPSEQEGEEENTYFKPLILEAVFAHEWRLTDNMGDINADGVPDTYAVVKKWSAGYLYQQVEGSESGGGEGEGAIGGGDLTDLDGLNTDEDYLPAPTSGGNSLIPNVQENWATLGEKFSAYYEIRGFGCGLNYRRSDDGLNYNVCGEWISDPEFTPAETNAYIRYCLAQGVDTNSVDIFSTDFLNAVSWSPENRTDPTKEDTDEDGLPDGYEYYFWYRALVGDENGVQMVGSRFNPENIAQGIEITPEEIVAAFNPTVKAMSEQNDTDGDGLTDLEELAMGTNPVHWDTDGDGMSDLYEVMWDLDPLKDFDMAAGYKNPDGDYMASWTSDKTWAIVTVPGKGVYAVDETVAALVGFVAGDKDDEGILNPSEQSSFDGIPVFWYGLDGSVAVPKIRRAVKGKKLLKSTTTVDISAVTKPVMVKRNQSLLLIHDQVYEQFGFNARTGWSIVSPSRDENVNKNAKTAAYTSLDEYLLCKYRKETGLVGGDKLNDDLSDAYNWTRRTVAALLWTGCTAPNTPFEGVIYGDCTMTFSSEIHGADTDGDGMPDGWELYGRYNPNKFNAMDSDDEYEQSSDEATLTLDMGGGKSVTVPQAWIEEHPALVAAAGGDASAALASKAANGRLSVVECYVLGLDPESTTNDFKITSFPMKADGTPDLENIVFDPPEARWNVEGARPVVKGAATLGSEWQAVTEENKAGFRFFKVEVVLP